MTPGLESCHALVLNADFRPLSYFPLSIWSWQDAVKAVFLDRVSVISEYDRMIHSPSFEMRLPSVIALKEYVPAARRPAFTRFNVFLRDHFICQYCNGDFATNELTFDHVVPKSRGGRTSLDQRRDRLQPVQPAQGQPAAARERHDLQRYPSEPTTIELQENGRAFPPGYLHESWRDFLYWDSELETDNDQP